MCIFKYILFIFVYKVNKIIDIVGNLRTLLANYQWYSGSGATGAIAPVPIFQGGAPLQFLLHLFLVNFDYILQKLAYCLNYYW